MPKWNWKTGFLNKENGWNWKTGFLSGPKPLPVPAGKTSSNYQPFAESPPGRLLNLIVENVKLWFAKISRQANG